MMSNYTSFLLYPVRDNRLVEKNKPTFIRMPSGKRPEYGCIPTTCREWKTDIFLPSDTFLTECTIN